MCAQICKVHLVVVQCAARCGNCFGCTLALIIVLHFAPFTVAPGVKYAPKSVKNTARTKNMGLSTWVHPAICIIVNKTSTDVQTWSLGLDPPMSDQK